MASRKLAIRDEPNIRLRCSRMSKTLVLPLKNEADDDPSLSLTSSPCVHSTVPVCTFNTSPCMPVPRAHVENMCARGAGTHGFFQRVTHHTHHTTPQPTTTTRPQHHTDRQTEMETQETKEKKTRQEKREERREKFIFSVVVHGRFQLCSALSCSSRQRPIP